MNNYKVAIVGFGGYSGAELVLLLINHPRVDPVLLEHRQDSGNHPQLIGARQPPAVPCSPDAVKTEHLALVFLATPAGVSMELAPQLRDAGTYARWYQEKHTAPQLLADAVYGLPEFCRDGIAQARLISNPGCYPTAAN